MGVVRGCALFGSSWLQFGGWLLCNQPLDAALHRVALFVPSGHCWKRQWLRCIIRILVVDAGKTKRQLPEWGNAPAVMLTLAMNSL